MELSFQIKDVPPQFVNALRRIMLNEMPVVELTNVQVLENTTLMPHEMLKLRTELLPVNVRPSEQDIVRSGSVELRILSKEDQSIHLSDFATAPRNDILFDPDIFFLKLKKGNAVHITANLGIKTSSHCCVATYGYHVDPELSKLNKEIYLQTHPGQEKVWDNIYAQRSFSKNEQGRPNWFDFTIESIGVVPARDILQEARTILLQKMSKWCELVPVKESEQNVVRVTSREGGVTVCALVQAILHESKTCEFVAYDQPHPLHPEVIVRILSSRPYEELIRIIMTQTERMCKLLI